VAGDRADLRAGIVQHLEPQTPSAAMAGGGGIVFVEPVLELVDLRRREVVARQDCSLGRAHRRVSRR
jgi:hypothetical protein